MIGRLLTRFLRLLLVSVPLAWLLAGAVMWIGQERLLFPAPRVGPTFLSNAAERADVDVLDLVTPDGVRLMAWSTHRETHERGLIFFHGNGATLRASAWVHDFGAEHGWDVLSIAWRGYPGSDGRPSEAGLRIDALAAFDHLAERHPAERIGVYGHSLGGAMAVWVAHERQAGALVVDSSFRSMTAMAQRAAPLYPVAHMLRHPFDSELLAEGVMAPGFVVHSSADQLIPIEQGRSLASALPHARFLALDGHGHNALVSMSVPEVREQLAQFLDQAVPPIR